MKSWLRTFLGLGEGEVPAGGDSHLELTGLPPGNGLWLAALVAAGSVALIVWLYRRERELGFVPRSVLALLRLVALAVVLFMLLDPRILTEIRREREAHTLVLFDASGSMSQRDEYEGAERVAIERASGLNFTEPATRTEIALAAIERQGLIPLLEQKNSVRYFAFDAGVRTIPGLEPKTVEPAGETTALGDAVRAVLAETASELVAGLVIISDGRSNAGEAPVKASGEAAARGVPVHAVGIGKTHLPKNYAVTGFSGPEVVEPGYPIRLEARIEASGFRGQVTVVLTRQPVPSQTTARDSRAAAAAGPIVKVEERKLDLKGLHFSTALVFTDTLEKKGAYRYVVTIPDHPDEAERGDNTRDLRVSVTDDTCRVLLVSGSPTWEFRRLRDFLIRDDGLQVSTYLSSADRGFLQDGDVVIREVPGSSAKLRPYDVILLLDPDPALFTAEQVQGLAEFVLTQGGGLAYVAGETFSGKFFAAPAMARLRALLPVEGAGAPRGLSYKTPWRPRLTRQGAEHPLCRMVDDPAENARIWSILPPLFYLAPARTLKPVATQLLEREPGEIVAATQRSGAGYTFYLGTDDLNWWRGAASGAQERFWSGIVRYLAIGKRLAGSKEATLLADRDRYTAGDDVVLEASLLDGDRQPLLVERVEVAVERAGGGDEAPAASEGEAPSAPPAAASLRLNLLPAAGRPGWYAARFRAEEPGRYEARIASAVSSGSPAEARASFAVISLSTEWEDPSPDPAALEELAKRTGGTVVDLGDLASIAERIPDRRVSEIIGRSASTIWDSGPLLMIFALALIAEWILRKVWRLN